MDPTEISTCPSSISVGYATADDTSSNSQATGDVDYIAVVSSGTLTFAPGETTKTIVVPIIDDVDQEPNETFLVTLSNPTGNGLLQDDEGVGTIEANDSANDPTALYVYDIRFDSKRGGKDWRAVVEIRSDSNADGQAGADDDVRAGVTVTVNFGGNSYTGTTDSNGVFRTDWIRNMSSGSHYANVVDLALAGYFWDPLDLDDEDDSDGDGKPDDLLVL